MVRRTGAFFLLVSLFSFLATNANAANPQWVQVKSPNFTVLTDAGEKRGRDVALHFEQMRAVFGTLFSKAKITSSQPLYILAFRNTKEFRSMCPLWKGKPVELAGFFQQGNGVTYIALDLSTENKWEVIFHEYGHFLLNANTDPLPPWFDEGFAQYFETVKVEGNNFVFGAIPQGAPYILRENRWLPVDQLFSVGHDSPFYNESNRMTIFYAESWLAMCRFWFQSPQRQQVIDFMTLQSQGMPVDAAIQKAFGEDAKTLDKDLQTFYSTGRVGQYRNPMPAGIDNLPMTAAAVDDIDARARIAELKLQTRDHQAEAVQEFEDIIKQKPDQPVALRGLAYASLQKGDRQAAADYFKRAAATHSDDAHVYYFSAILATQMGAQVDPELLAQMQKNLEQAVKLDPTFADAYGLLALTYLWQRKDEEALAPAQKAVELSPRNDQWAMNLAGLYANAKRYDDAIKLCQRLTKSTNPAVAQQASSMLAGLTQYRASMSEYENHKSGADDTRANDDTGPRPVLRAHTTGSEAPARSGDKVHFAGTLASVTCSGKQATFKITSSSGTLLLSAPDVSEVSFSGLDEFSCNMRNVTVKGVYSSAKGNQLVSLEFE